MILSPYFWLGVIGVAVGIFFAGEHQGKKVERADFNAYKAQIATEREAGAVAAAKERRQHELALAATDTALQKARIENEALKDSDRRHALSGDLRLRIPSVCPKPATDATASPSVRDAGAPAEGVLPPGITADLFTFANRADSLSDQLRACQQVVIEDRKDSQ